MKTITTLLFMLLCITVKLCAQDTLFTYFSKLYADPPNGLRAAAALSQANGNTVFCSRLISDGFGEALILTTVDRAGEVVKVQKVAETADKMIKLFPATCMIQDPEGDILIVYSVYTLTESGLRVIKLKSDGAIIDWQYEYEFEDPATGAAITKTADGSYLVVGYEQLQLEVPNIMVIKISATGQHQWVRKYFYNELTTNESVNCGSMAMAVVQLDTGGFLVSGGIGLGYDCEQQRRSVVLVMAENGDLLGTAKLYAGTNQHPSTIHKTSDNRMLVATNISTGLYGSIFYLQELNAQGQEVAVVSYQSDNIKRLSSPILSHEQGFICIVVVGPFNTPTILKLGETLEVESLQEINGNVFSSMDVADLAKSEDHGYVLCGDNSALAPSENYFSWLAKFDSLGHTCGNWNQPCDSTIVNTSLASISSPFQDELALHFHPNPAAERLMLTYKLPLNMPKATIYLYDLIGREVSASQLLCEEGGLTLDVSHLPPGPYIYTLQSNLGTAKRGKILIAK